MAYTYKRLIRISVRDSCGVMDVKGSNDYLDRVERDIVAYMEMNWPGITVKLIGECD
jgi:hypothetical protein